jgi:glycosyltransferase involved in cell wall biosynthesis
MKVLFYYPSNKQSNSLETLIYELSLKSMEVSLLTTCVKGPFHKALEEKGIRTFTSIISNRFSIVYYLRQFFFLINFCKKYQIDIVCSHLQHVNIISVFAQFFTRTRFIIFRHHFKFNVFSNDFKLSANRTEVLFDKIINMLAKEIIVPSSGVYNGMIDFEKVNKSKLKILPYIYNFDEYAKPDEQIVSQIKELYPCKLRLLMCSRLIPFKRHYLVFPIINKLVKQGYDIKLMVLDEGPEKENLENYINENELQKHISMLGFRSDFINYMAASDLLIHPSLTEASNSSVKEMGLLKKTVAVCSKVGDFDDYIINEANGFLLNPLDTEIHLEELLVKIYSNNYLLIEMGENLHDTVLNTFNRSPKIINRYLELFKTNNQI